MNIIKHGNHEGKYKAMVWLIRFSETTGKIYIELYLEAKVREDSLCSGIIIYWNLENLLSLEMDQRQKFITARELCICLSEFC